jgi:hypothetical protein
LKCLVVSDAQGIVPKEEWEGLMPSLRAPQPTIARINFHPVILIDRD